MKVLEVLNFLRLKIKYFFYKKVVFPKKMLIPISTNIEIDKDSTKSVEKIKEYIREQLKQDQLAEQLTMDLNDPFTGKQ